MNFEKLKEKWKHERAGGKSRAGELKRLLLERGRPVFEKFGIKKVILFGSVQNGSCGKGADIDIYAHPLPVGRYWDFLHEMERAVESPVDLYTEKDDRVFVDKIITRGEIIYEV